LAISVLLLFGFSAALLARFKPGVPVFFPAAELLLAIVVAVLIADRAYVARQSKK
jgi:hypothetical protein